MKKGREKKNPKDDIEIYKLFIRQSLRINGYINGSMVAAYGNIYLPSLLNTKPIGLMRYKVQPFKTIF